MLGFFFVSYTCLCFISQLLSCHFFTYNFHCSGQGRINHCAGCTMGGGSRRLQGRGDQLQNFSHAVLRFVRWTFSVGLNVKTAKTVVSFFWGRKLHPREAPPEPEKILATRLRKVPRLLRWYGAPEWLIRAWSWDLLALRVACCLMFSR